MMHAVPEEFRPYFWDTDFESLDLKKNGPFIISRLYNKGGARGINYVHHTYTDDDIIHAVKTRRDFHPIVANYLRQKYHLTKSDMAYYRMQPTIPWR